MKKVYTLNKIESQGYCEEKYNEIIGRLKALAKQCREFSNDGSGTIEYSKKWGPTKIKVPNSFSYVYANPDIYTLRIELTTDDEIVYIDGLDHYHKLLDYTLDNWEKIGLETALEYDLNCCKEK